MDKYKIISLNVNGMRRNTKRKNIFSLIRKQKVDIACLQETHITDDTYELWKKEWGSDFIYHKGSPKSLGQIILIGKNICQDDDILKCTTIISKDDRTIAVNIKTEIGQICVVNCYAPNDNASKIIYHGKINNLVKNIDADYKCVLGDFNTVIDNNFDIISGEKHSERVVNEFQNMVSECNLIDTWRIFHANEKEYSWSTRDNKASRRLDYMFLSENLFNEVVNCFMSSVPFSDHRYVSIEIKNKKIERGPGYWKFNNFLLKDKNFITMMNQTIENYHQNNVNRLDKQMKWELLKLEIKQKAINFGKIRKRQQSKQAEKLYAQLDEYDRTLGENPDNEEIIEKRNRIKLEVEIIEDERAKRIQNLARVKWIEQGEKNTAFFMNLEKSRANAKIMTSLETENGQKIDDQFMILDEQKKYYQNLYKKKQTRDELENINQFLQGHDHPKLSEEEKDWCEGLITEEEAANALKVMNNGSAPGLDGLTTEFYKVFWIKIKNTLLDSINNAFEKGHMSNSQSAAVITLIHKGKDLPRDKLNNWRPISLTNTDYKILAKSLSIRLSKVIDKIVDPNQVGFIKGRRVADIIRTIDDITEYLKNENKPGVLMAIDFKKAFDSISKKFMINAFKSFGFGNQFVRWVETIMANTKSSIGYCGWRSEDFNTECGIRQGCPFSPMAFVIGLEILAIKIRNNPNVKGLDIKTKNIINTIKILLYADDITLILKNREDIRLVLDLLNAFKDLSGLEINIQKTEAMYLGSLKNNLENNEGITLKKQLKILGVHFSAERSASLIDENWTKRIDKMKRIISVWEKRNLGLIGKICIIKSFLISQFVYLLQAINIPDKIIETINTILFRFLWRKKNCNKKAFEKVKRKVICSETKKGGLNMIDIRAMYNAFQCERLKRIFFTREDKLFWKIFPHNILDPMGNLGLTANTTKKETKGLENIKSQYWKQALKTWIEIKHATYKEKEREEINHSLWNNYSIKCQGKVLLFQDWAKMGISTIEDITDNEGKIVLQEIIEEKIGRSPNRIIEYLAIKQAVTNFIRQKYNNSFIPQNNEKNCVLLNNPKLVSARDFRLHITELNYTEPCAKTLWRRKYGIEVDEKYWTLPLRISSESRIRELAWKILHNIYPTRILLKKLKITESDKCKFCPDELEYVEHFFFHCNKIKIMYNIIKDKVYQKYSYKIEISEEEAMLGIVDKKKGNKEIREYANRLILIAKMCCGIIKYNKEMIPRLLFEREYMIFGF